MRKHFLLMAALLLGVGSLSAQSVIRHGNTYEVNGTTMKKEAFAEYMQANAPTLCSDYYRKGLKISYAGWSCLSVGLATQIVTLPLYACLDHEKTPLKARQSMASLFGIGGCAVISGLVCIPVGYVRMHRMADYYAKGMETTQAYWTFQVDNSGLGLALHF